MALSCHENLDRKPPLNNQNVSGASLQALPAAERELVAAIIGSEANAADLPFLQMARVRLRNIVEKYSEALKRARLALRSAEDSIGRDAERIHDLQIKLDLCRAALERCNFVLSREKPDE